MKELARDFLLILLAAFFVFITAFWLMIPVYYGVQWLCSSCGLSTAHSNKIALIATVAIDVACGALVLVADAERSKKEAERVKEVLKQLSEETSQSAPWFAAKIADAVALADNDLSMYLRTKKHPARKAAEQVKEISKEKRDLLYKSKGLEYQLQFYEKLFPWLEEFKTVPTKEAIEYVHATDDDYDRVRNWLSPKEYTRLSSIEKNQLALDRYMRRKKSDWDVGIEYERYIGYLGEKEGFHVIYNGAIEGLSDMGRDIISYDGDQIVVIQCKRWAKEKDIHEKHIFQLYGSVILMQIKTGIPCIGRFVTTAHLSETARECADFLGIEYFEEWEYKDYPLVKCNVAKNGEKIYHLPFDQQYDRVQISGKKDAMFAWTVAEAEQNGFRHAHRWIPDTFQGIPRRAFAPSPSRRINPALFQKCKNETKPPQKIEIPSSEKKSRQAKKPLLKPGEVPLHPDFAIPYRDRYAGKSVSKEAGVPDGVWFDENAYPHKEHTLGLDEFTVYMTEKGKVYHRADCICAKGAKAVNICFAIDQRRRSCQQCRPMENLPSWVLEYQRIDRLRRLCNIDMLP